MQNAVQSSKWPSQERAILKDFGAKLRTFKHDHMNSVVWKRVYRGVGPTKYQARQMLTNMTLIATKLGLGCCGSDGALPDFSIMVFSGTKQICFTFHVNRNGVVLNHTGCN